MVRLFAMAERGTMGVKTGLAEMLKGGVIMDVTTAEQARIAEDAGAVAVMALERVPSDIRRDGGVARMADPTKIREIQEAVTIPVMAKARIGHFVEAQVLQALDVDYIDESEVLTPADEEHHIDKWAFDIPFVCGCRDLGEALRRLSEGAAMIRTKGEAGTGDIVNAVRHMRTVFGGIRRLGSLLRGRALHGGQEPPRAARARAPRRRGGPAAGRHVHRGWHRDSRRRRALHAARRRRRLRRLRDLQERGSVDDGQGDRRGRRRTSATPTCSRASRPGSASRCAASPPPASRPKSCSKPAAGSSPPYPERGDNGVCRGIQRARPWGTTRTPRGLTLGL